MHVLPPNAECPILPRHNLIPATHYPLWCTEAFSVGKILQNNKDWIRTRKQEVKNKQKGLCNNNIEDRFCIANDTTY